MVVEHIINLVVSLAVFVFLFINFIKHHKEDRVKRVIWYFLLIGCLYFIIAIFSFIWSFSILEYIETDFLFIYTLIILLQSFFLFIILYQVMYNRKLFYFLISYIVIFFLVLLLGILYMNYFIVASFLFMLLTFIGLVMTKQNYRVPGYFGIIYCIVSIFLHALFFLNIGCLCYFNVVSNFLFFIFVFYFFRKLEECPPEIVVKKGSRKKNYFIVFLSHFVFMLVLINFIFVGTIVLHEFGHLAVSNFYDCEYGKIVYEGGFPRTEIVCSDPNQDNSFLLVSGLLFPFIIAILLLIVGGKFLREIALLLIGFNLVISFKDFTDLGMHDNIIMFFIILGIFLAIAGIILLARSKTEEYIYSLTG